MNDPSPAADATPRAIVLLSGGLDSSTCLAVALREGFDVYPLSFRYGQRHARELEAAARVLEHYAIPAARHRVVDLGQAVGGSALTGEGEVPLGRDPDAMAEEIPATYVPARNIVFLALAASFGEHIGATDIFIGVNALDYSGYPDCRPAFIQAFEAMLNLGTRSGVEGRPFRLHTPLIDKSKAEIVKLAASLGAPLHLTYSCYQGTWPPCGTCDACLLRRKGFREAGRTDPLL